MSLVCTWGHNNFGCIYQTVSSLFAQKSSSWANRLQDVADCWLLIKLAQSRTAKYLPWPCRKRTLGCLWICGNCGWAEGD